MEVYNRIKGRVGGRYRIRHLILTVRSVPRIDGEYFVWLRRCFERLRHRKVFKSVEGGVYAIETTHNDAGWHVHIHAVLVGGFIPHGELQRAWSEIVGDEAIVWIKLIPFGKGVQYVLGDVVKGKEWVFDSELLAEYLLATWGTRLFSTWGCLYGVNRDGVGKEGVVCPVCGSYAISFINFKVVSEYEVMRLGGGWVYDIPPPENKSWEVWDERAKSDDRVGGRRVGGVAFIGEGGGGGEDSRNQGVVRAGAGYR